MSASREKKERQNAGTSQRGGQARQDEAAYKRKVRLYTGIGVIAVVLVAALLLWNSGIFQRGTIAASVGDTKYTVTDLSFYYQNARYNSTYFYYMYGMTPPADSDVMDADSGKTYRDSYMEMALENLARDTALYDEAVASGLTEQDVAKMVDEQIESTKSAAAANGSTYGAYLKAQFGKYMTPSAFKSAVTRAAMAQECYDRYYDGLEYSEADIQTYYNENKNFLDTFEYSYLYFTPEAVADTNEDGSERTDEEKEELTAAALADAKQKADGALAALQDGSEVADAISTYAPGSSADHTVSVGANLASAVYASKLYEMIPNEYDLVENGESGYYVVVLHTRTRVDDATQDTRHILIRAESTTDAENNVIPPTEAAWNKAKEQADKILSEYQSGEQTEEAFAALAEKYSEDTGSNTNGGLYEGVYRGQFVSEYDSWLFDSARKAGDVELIRHEDAEPTANSYFGYHIVYYVGQNEPIWKLTAEKALRDADAAEWESGVKEGYTATLEAGADLI